jgi:hypothetical protein
MRSPVVKRHISPRSGFFAFLPLFQSWRRQPPGSCPDVISVWVQMLRGCPTPVWRLSQQGNGKCRATGAWSSAAETLLGALVPSAAQGGRHDLRAPVRVRRGGGAAHGDYARLPPQPPAPERGATHRGRAEGAGSLGSWAFTDAASPLCPRPLARRPPWPSSAASGSPAPLPTDGDTGP